MTVGLGKKIGLAKEEVERRQAQYGLNQLQDSGYRSFAQIIICQLGDLLILILIAAAIVAWLAADQIDFYILVAVVLINTLMGAVQEYRAERALLALKKMLPLKVKVVRKGKLESVGSEELVPGDIIILEAGDQVPADAKLINAAEFQVDESLLTGESVPVRKSLEKKREIYSGTTVVSGHGQAEVSATGSRARIGQIAGQIAIQEEQTPLQRRLVYLGKILALITSILAALIFFLGIIKGMALSEIFIYAISLLVSAVPESLPVVTTLALAIGVLRMSRHQAITRHLPALETLGTIDIIASDKTGTLTKNQMTVKEIWLPGERYQVKGVGYRPDGRIVDSRKRAVDPKRLSRLGRIIKTGAICNNARLVQAGPENRWQVIGDPTEGALLALAQKTGLFKKEITGLERIKELPFSADSKRMAVVVKEGRGYQVYTKGAPEVIIRKCSSIAREDQVAEFSREGKEKWLKNARRLARRGYRILALAQAETAKFNNPEENLSFLGLVAMIDPPLLDAAESLREAKLMGVRTVIITGDHMLTAKWVMEKIGIKLKKDQIMIGSQLDDLTDSQLEERVGRVKLWARITPGQKQRIITAMKRQGWSVAVTGDGVNDAPALKAADVGIAMGRQGTDVARQAADIILKNDRFSAIIAAIKYGRTIYDNIRKFFTFLLSGNFDEIMLVTIAFLFGLPQPFTAGQILWINLITDSFPALALAFEKPAEKRLGRPRDPETGIIKPILRYALFIGLIALAFSLAILLIFREIDPSRLRTYIFTLAVFIELFAVFAIRSEKPFWQESPFKNKVLVLAVVVSIILQLIAIYSPLNRILKTVPLNLQEWGMIIGLSALSYLIIEITKATKLKEYFGLFNSNQEK